MSFVPQVVTGEVSLFGRKVGNPAECNPLKMAPRHRALIIAELGLNHAGNADRAMDMIRAAAAAGVDVVKLQKRELSTTYTKKAMEDPNAVAIALAHYMPILRECELSCKTVEALKALAEGLGLGFLVTPFDEPSVDFLEGLGQDVYKISSADFTNPFLHRKIAATGKPVIISTGMTAEAEVFGMMSSLKELFPDRLVLMHAVSSYPAAYRDCNLHMIFRMKINHRIPVGWSGHERGVAVSVSAAALGADVIERHFTLDRTLPGPDQAASLEPDGLRKLVERIRATEEAYGDPFGIREPNRGELSSREVLGKSLVARRHIPKGKILEWEDLEARSPGRGVSPAWAQKLIGTHYLKVEVLEGMPLIDGDLVHAPAPIGAPVISPC